MLGGSVAFLCCGYETLGHQRHVGIEEGEGTLQLHPMVGKHTYSVVSVHISQVGKACQIESRLTIDN